MVIVKTEDTDNSTTGFYAGMLIMPSAIADTNLL